MGGRSSSGNRNTSSFQEYSVKSEPPITIREGMSPQEVDAAHTQIANLARKATEERDNKINVLSQQAISGKVPVSEVPRRMEAINKEYDNIMSKLRADNDKLARLYGISQLI